MNTIDEYGNVIATDNDAAQSVGFGNFGPLVRPLQIARQLSALHGQLASVPIDQKSVLLAIGLTAAIGGAYFLNRHYERLQTTNDDFRPE